MKNLVLAIILIVGVGLLGVSAQDKDSPLFQPYTPEVLAQGNSFTANAHGYNSLFTNPAGFARDGGSFTVLSATATPYFVLNEEDLEGVQQLADNPEDAVGLLSDIITTNGFGGAASIGGVGIVGRGLGLGLVGNMDFYGRGTTALGTDIDVAFTGAAIAGYAIDIPLGFADIYVGADARYMQRAEIRDVLLTDFLAAAGGEEGDEVTFSNTLYGSGLAFDAGAIVERGPFAIGMSLRDIGGTKMNYKQASDVPMSEIGSLISGDDTTLAGEDPTAEYRIPMTVSYGASYHPDLGPLSWLIDPTVHFEIADTMYAEREPSFWTKVHAGAEVRVLRFMKARLGINQGYVTAGVGAKLLFLDVNAAYFAREMSDYAGARPNEGFSVEVALRF